MEKDLKSVTYQPKVSILVPVYNVESYIEKCARSLFAQTYQNIEFVFVNDCTTDQSILVLKKLIESFSTRKSQIKILEHPHNKGIGATRNTLLAAATGDYLLWVDSDDFISEEAVEILVSEIIKIDSDLISSDSYYFYRGEGKSELFSQNLPANSKQYIEALACHQVRAAVWGTLSKHELWVNNKISFSDTMTFGEDYFATIQLFYFAKSIQSIHFPFYYYNQANINSYTTGYKTESHFKSLLNLFGKLESFFSAQNAENEYSMFLKKAIITEFSSLLLHTTRDLRRKYSWVISANELSLNHKKTNLTKWQQYILYQIINNKKLYSDFLLFMAKILRLTFKIKF
jgi:glycosyltransferase involved in cell wall biosynthesis